MQTEFQQYRFALVEARTITRTRFEAQFNGQQADTDDIEKAVAQQLATEPSHCVPWRVSEIERRGCRDGIRMAALEFYWERRRRLRQAGLAHAPNRPSAECGFTAAPQDRARSRAEWTAEGSERE
jgi:hypothetical protein